MQTPCSLYGATLKWFTSYFFIAGVAGSFHWSPSAKSPFQALCVEDKRGDKLAKYSTLSYKEKTEEEGEVKYRVQFRD